MASAPLINGRRFSYTSTEIAITTIGKPFTIYNDIIEASYSERLAMELVHGTSRSPIGWTAGTYEPGEASLTIGKSSFQDLIQSIGIGWLGINIQATLIFSEIGEKPCTDTLIGRIIGAEDTMSYGPAPLATKLTIGLFSIARNGILPMLNRVV